MVWNIVRWPLAFVAVLLLFALIYYLAPNEDQRSWKWITPGSLVGAVMWLALRALRPLHVVQQLVLPTYGTLAGGIILLLWLNYGVGDPLRRGAERRARPSGRHPRGGRAEGGPDQAREADYLTVKEPRRRRFLSER